MKEILGIEQVNYSKSDAFQKHTTATKEVLEDMAIGEREGIYTQVEWYKQKGLLDEIQH